MLKKILTSIFFVFSLPVLASNAIYTSGDGASALLADRLFPEKINVRKPGADGILLWTEFIKDKGSLSIQQITTTHNLHNSRQVGFVDQAKLVAILATSNVYLFSHKDSSIKQLSDLSKKTYTIASTNPNGICALSMSYIANANNIKFVSIPYKTPQEASVAFLGKHVDMLCTSGTAGHAILNTPNIHLVLNLTKEYGVRVSQYLFAHKDISKDERVKLISTLREKINTIDAKIFADNGLNVVFLTGKDAVNFFNEDGALMQLISQNKDK